MSSVKERAEEDVKRQAAKLGANIVLLQLYNSRDSELGKTLAKVTINGVAYGFDDIVNTELAVKKRNDKTLRDGPIDIPSYYNEFEVGEKVLAKIDSKFYEAIITELKPVGATIKYLENGKEKKNI